MYQYVCTWVFGFKFSVSVYLLCTSVYVPGFLVLRFSGFCLSVFIMYQYVRTWVFGFKVLSFLSQCIYYGPKGNVGHFWRFAKKEKFTETGDTKISLHAFHIELYLTCMNCLSWFFFLTPMDYYSPWSERKFWPFAMDQNITLTFIWCTFFELWKMWVLFEKIL